MRQAITTRYSGPTASGRGSVIIARCHGGRITEPYSHELSRDGEHAAAAKQLAVKMAGLSGRGWCGYWVGGGLPDESGNCYVWAGGNDLVPDNSVLGVEGEDWFWVPLSVARDR